MNICETVKTPKLKSFGVESLKTPCSGFTLFEAVIALALWLILSLGIFLVWQHSALMGAELLERQSAFENARISMDALIMNFKLSRRITLYTDGNDVLQLLVLNQLNPQGRFKNYTFRFNANASLGTARHHRLDFGNNEFASNIAKIQIQYIKESRMQITITTGCPNPIILEGSVDVRYKDVVVFGGSSFLQHHT